MFDRYVDRGRGYSWKLRINGDAILMMHPGVRKDYFYLGRTGQSSMGYLTGYRDLFFLTERDARAFGEWAWENKDRLGLNITHRVHTDGNGGFVVSPDAHDIEPIQSRNDVRLVKFPFEGHDVYLDIRSFPTVVDFDIESGEHRVFDEDSEEFKYLLRRYPSYFSTGARFGLFNEDYLSDLYDLTDETAYWSKDGVERRYGDSMGTKWDPEHARSYRVRMSPKQFLDLTTEEGADALKVGQYVGISPLAEFDPQKFSYDKYQPIFLEISFPDKDNHEIAQVTGHEGRHRMFGLMLKGIKSVDVELMCNSYATEYNRYKPFKLDKLTLIGQFNHSVRVTVDHPIPLSYETHQRLGDSLEEGVDLTEAPVLTRDRFEAIDNDLIKRIALKYVLDNGYMRGGYGYHNNNGTSYRGSPTVDGILRILREEEDPEQYAADMQTFDDMDKWIRELEPSGQYAGFQQRIKDVWLKNHVAREDLPVLAAACNSYDNEMQYKRRQAARQQREREHQSKVAGRANEYVGTVGDKISFVISEARIVTHVHPGSTWNNLPSYPLWSIVDTEGHTYTWGDSTGEINLEGGMKVEATVVGHTEFRGIKQTRLRRLKVLEKTVRFGLFD